MAILYRHIRLDKNEPFYIGIGTDDKITQTKIAEFFGVDQSTISKYIKKYRNIK